MRGEANASLLCNRDNFPQERDGVGLQFGRRHTLIFSDQPPNGLGFATVEMIMQGGNDAGGSLLDGIERNRIVRPKPPRSLQHVLMFVGRQRGIQQSLQIVVAVSWATSRARKSPTMSCREAGSCE